MSIIRNIQKSRIVAIPLTRSSPQILKSPKTDGSRYTYYQFQIVAQEPKKPIRKPSSAGAKGAPPPGGLSGIIAQIKEQGFVTWSQGKAADTWAGFGKAEGGWKLKLYQTGERIVDRLDFEELALKSLDPSMGPSIRQMKGSPVYEKKDAPAKIPLLFPPSILSPSEALSDLRAYAEHRIPRHRNGVAVWVLAMPFTIPFMIIPVIPNIPFFFCVWRAWSHYAAFRSSQYLRSLADHDILVPEPCKSLDLVYQRKQLAASTASASSISSESAPSPSSPPPPPSEPKTSQTSGTTSTAQEPQTQDILLLSHDDVPVILSTLDLQPDSNTAVDLSRAIEQARVRVSKGGHSAI